MFNPRIWSLAGLVSATVLGGCVADGPLSVAPGQGKSYADLQRDDAACRAAPVPAPTAVASAPTTAQTTPAPSGTYYQCMAARGQMVVANRTVAYPAYPAYAYAPYPYGYAYPYGYPYFGYPYSAAYVGVGIGFGGGFYRDRGFYGGYRGGGYRGGGRR